MAFYGNITNTSQTTFQFDRIYSNRLEMEVNCPNDGIFVGRYVLVEYDDEAAFPVVYKINNKFYTTSKEDANTQIKYGGTIRPASETIYSSLDKIYLNEIVQTQLVDETIQFYKCTGGDNGIAIFEHLNKDVTSTNNYIRNFSIDEQHYNPTEEKSDKWKGFDSTVWVKTTVTIDGKLYTKYIWIADLNSVVPTFDLETDAPTMKPLVPHFDADSTNVYYKLHTQPQWGLRVAEVESEKVSDSKTNWISSTYDPETGQLIPSKDNGEHDAAIYFNRAAFLPQVDINRKTTDGIEKKKEDGKENNYFTINPTGTSGNQYYLHTALDQNGNLQKVYGPAIDIQEMRINLPAIGNMMSDAWDIIYGPKRDKARTDEDGSLQGRLDSFKAIEDNHIPIKRNDDGTIIGTAINGNNNYQMPNGKNILTTTHFPLTTNDPWINVTIDNSSLHGGYDKDNKIEISQKNNNAIRIRHSANSVDSTTTSWDKNDAENYTNNSYNYYEIDTNINGNQDEIKLYTPYVDATGHVVGKNIETITLPYGYKYFKTNGIVSEDEKDDLYSTNVNTNGIQETKLTNVESDTEAHNTQDTLSINPANKWIQTKLVDTENDGDVLTIAHEIHSIDETVSKQGDNETSHSNLNKEDGANNEINLTMYDWTYDKAGHITSKRKHTYTLPFSYKNIEITNEGNASSAEPASVVGTQTANATQDNLKLTTSNKWILLDASEEDVIKIGHKLSGIEAKEHSSSDTDIANFGDSFNILKFTTDKAGHITNVQEESIKIPNIVFTNDNSGNVVTNMAYNYNVNNKTGTFTETRKNIGTLSLGTHTGITTTTNGLNIISSDTISDAFNKTQTHINNLKLESTDSDSDWVADVTQTDGQVAIIRKGTNNLKLKDYSALTGVSTMELDSNDTLNNAFGKLEYRIKEEEKNREDAINALSVTDTIDNTKYVSGVSETNGKITVSRAGTDTLKLSNYSIGSNGQDITNNDTINSAFGKLQKQIKNIIGNGEIADEFNTIKEIADWLKENDSNADKIIDSIATLNSDDTTEGSVANSIKVAIEGLDSSKVADTNKYISGITITNGKITDIQQTALGGAAYKNAEYFAKAEQGSKADSAIQPNTKFIYGAETKTIQDLMTIVNKQAATITALSGKINELEQRIAALEPTTGE